MKKIKKKLGCQCCGEMEQQKHPVHQKRRDCAKGGGTKCQRNVGGSNKTRTGSNPIMKKKKEQPRRNA